MDQEESDLYWAVIESLKSPTQKRQEAIEKFTLAQHPVTLTDYPPPFVSWFEEITYEPHKQEYLDAGDIPSEDWKVYDLHVCETYDGKFSYIDPRLQTEYRVVENPATHELSILSSWCNLIHCRKFYQSLEDD
jgi:hypothetical protein